MSLHQEHPLRRTLNDEIHARPPVPLDTPEFVTYLAFIHTEDSTQREDQHLADLCEQLGQPAPDCSHGHLFVDAGSFRLKWERHGEFSTYTFIRRTDPDDNTVLPALLAVPAAWRQDIPGELMVATHVELRSVDRVSPEAVLARATPRGRTLVATQVGDGAGWVFTDFAIEDGFSHFTLLDAALTPRQAGRTVQRLVEIETYRMMALLAFPVAKEVGRLLDRAEGELADLMEKMGSTESHEDERQVLDQLTELAAEVERSVARSTYRFGAAAAYYQLVMQRIQELREVRQGGFPTISEFMERRLTPAIATCATMARRQEDLSSRIARNSQLLRTRVDIALEHQNQQLLAQMNRRAKIQLRLQETVEGLSVVAITYYASQLVHYMAAGAEHWLDPLTPEIITAVAIPVIASFVALGLSRMRKALAVHEEGNEAGH